MVSPMMESAMAEVESVGNSNCPRITRVRSGSRSLPSDPAASTPAMTARRTDGSRECARFSSRSPRSPSGRSMKQPRWVRTRSNSGSDPASARFAGSAHRPAGTQREVSRPSRITCQKEPGVGAPGKRRPNPTTAIGFKDLLLPADDRRGMHFPEKHR